MTLWNSEQLAEALGLPVPEGIVATGVSIDTRTLAPGDLFVALKGERFDGNTYAVDALEKGAAAAIVSDASLDEPGMIVVEDTEAALVKLGTYRRAAFAGKVIGVTGSLGKTSVKEALTALLSQQGQTHATRGNLNNHFGVPLTLARLPVEADYAVIEMGMNHAGEIRYLTKMARPDVAMITTVDAVHLEFFDSVEGIAEAKAEIFEGLESAGTAILPRDNRYYPLLQERAGAHAKRTFGQSAEADFQMVQTEETAEGQAVTCRLDGQKDQFVLALTGVHHAVNLLGVLAAMEAAGADISQAFAGMHAIQPTQGRGNRLRLEIDGKRITLIDDSYNASPASMQSALSGLAVTARQEGGRPVAALGDMLELGEQEKALHAGLVDSVVSNQIKKVFLLGKRMRYLQEVLPDTVEVDHTESLDLLKNALLEQLQDKDILLIKGSHGSDIWKLVEGLKAATGE